MGAVTGAAREMAGEEKVSCPAAPAMRRADHFCRKISNTNTDSASASEDSDESNDEVCKDWDSQLNDDL